MSQGDFDVLMGSYDELPHIMQEIGRGREESFRFAGGGTGEAVDLAEADKIYKHLFVWSRRDRAVVGAYRLGLADEILERHGPKGLVSSGLFEFKSSFLARLNPGLELGRSYVLPEYQRSYSSLLLLWGGILAFIARNPKYRMVFGSVGVSQGDEYCPASRTLIVDYMRREHGWPEVAVELDLSEVAGGDEPGVAGLPLEVSLTAVIEQVGQGVSYWALAHTGAEPDFHRRDSFGLKLLPGGGFRRSSRFPGPRIDTSPLLYV
jgi:hypothetical protein